MAKLGDTLPGLGMKALCNIVLGIREGEMEGQERINEEEVKANKMVRMGWLVRERNSAFSCGVVVSVYEFSRVRCCSCLWLMRLPYGST